SPTPAEPEEGDAVVPTEEPLFDLTSTEESAPTSEPEASEPEPTTPPTEAPVPTEEPEQPGRGDFPVPENTTGRSIVIERGPEDEDYIALTFDAGEGAGYTEDILDLLQEHNL